MPEDNQDIIIEEQVSDTEILESQTSGYAGHDLSIPHDSIGTEGEIRVAVDSEGQVFIFAKANGIWHSQLLGGVNFGSDVVQQTINNIVLEGNIWENATLEVGNLIAETVQANQQYKDTTNQISSQTLINHPGDSTQAHLDYLKNNAADTLEGTLNIKGSYNDSALGTFALEIGNGSLNTGQYNLVVGNPDNYGNNDGTEVYSRRIGFWTNTPTSKLHMNTSGDADLFHVLDSTGQINIGSDESETVPGKLNVSPNGSVNIGILASNHTTESPNYFTLNQSDTSYALLNNPYGDIAVGVLNRFRADSSGKDLGSSSTPWHTLFAQELYVETLVSQEVFATMGGRITVAPSTVLHSDMANNQTTIQTTHNNYANGDFAQFKVGVNTEIIKFTSDPVDQGGGEYFEATVQRSVSGSAVSWSEGTSLVILVNTVGAGIIELTATSTAQANSLGPTQIFKARSGTANWDDYKTNVILGNMNGALDYSTDTFGVAIGEDLYGGTNAGTSRITIDDTNGLRMYNTPMEHWHYDGGVGGYFKYFSLTPTDKVFSFGYDVTGSNTTNMKMFGVGTTWNSQTYNSGDIMFGSTSSGYANLIWRAYNSGGGAAQNILRIGTGVTGTGTDGLKINADGSGEAANGNISWTDTGDLTLTGTLTNIDDQIGDLSGAHIFYQATQPDHTSNPVPEEGDLWYDTDAGMKPHYLQSIADTDGSGTAGDHATDFLWTDIFYTEIDGSHITTGTITAVNLESFEVTTDSQGTIPGSDTGKKVFEIDMGATPVIKQYEKQDSPSWGSELSGGSFKFHFFENNGKTTYDYVKAQQMLHARYQELNVTQTFSDMGGKKMPDTNYVVIPVEARMPDLTISSSYCDDNTLDNYLGYVFDQKTNDSFRGQLIVSYGEESGWMRIPYTMQVGHNKHEESIDNRQHSSLDSPLLVWPEVAHSEKEYFGTIACGGSHFGYLYNRANNSSINSSRGIYPNQLMQWVSRKDNGNGGWCDFNDGGNVYGTEEENGSIIAHPIDATTYRCHRGIPNQWNDEDYYASGSYNDHIFGSSREGWRNGPLWRDLATQTSELSNSDYDNNGTGNLAELENNDGETYNAAMQGCQHDGDWDGGSFATAFGCGTWTQVSSNYAEPVFFGNSESGTAGSDFYGKWYDPDNNNAIWTTGINLLRWRTRAHIVYKAHTDNDDWGLHWAYETDDWVDDSTTGKGHIAFGAVVVGQCWTVHASTNYAYSTSEFGSPNMHSTSGRMHISREETGWKDKLGPMISVVPDMNLSMHGKEGTDSNNQGGQGTMYRNSYGFISNGVPPAQADSNLYWHFRNGNGQVSWYDSDNAPIGSMTIDGDSDWVYYVKYYERYHMCASGVDDQGMWAPIGHESLGYIQELGSDTGAEYNVGPQHQFGMQVPCGWMSRWNPQDTSSPYDDELFIGSSDRSPELVYLSWGRLEGKSVPIPIRRIGTGTGTRVHSIASSGDITRKLFGQHIMAVDAENDADQTLPLSGEDVAVFETDDFDGFCSGIEDLLG